MNGRSAKQQRRKQEQDHYQARLNLAVWCALSLAGGDQDEVRRRGIELMQLNDADLITAAEAVALYVSPLRSIIRPTLEVAHG